MEEREEKEKRKLKNETTPRNVDENKWLLQIFQQVWT